MSYMIYLKGRVGLTMVRPSGLHKGDDPSNMYHDNGKSESLMISQVTGIRVMYRYRYIIKYSTYFISEVV